MRTLEDLVAANRAGTSYFGYLGVDLFRCPPFLMFTNDDDCPVCHNIHFLKEFEPQSMALWCSLLPFATSVIDIGAQGGVYSLAAASTRTDIPIHAFEPNPDGFARLLVNIRANDFTNITPHRKAIGHKIADHDFNWVPKRLGAISSGGSLGHYKSPNATRIPVQMTILDEVLAGINLGRKPLIKIDVEGAESFVFEGMPQVLSFKPDILLESFKAESCKMITEMTKPLGYRYFFVDESNRCVVERDALIPADRKVPSFNQLLTVRSSMEVESLTE